MSAQFELVADWERLDRGSEQERACFASVGIRAGTTWLTEVDDSLVKSVRQRVHLSAYALAEWLAWNYWRLVAESREGGSSEWALSHHLGSIGGGYVWPNLVIQSDGRRVGLRAAPTEPSAFEPVRYLALHLSGVAVAEFSRAVELFIAQVRGRLRDRGVAPTNLDYIWDDILSERIDPGASRRRRLEALLGYDTDEAPNEVLQRLIGDSAVLGTGAADELAAAAGPIDPPWTATQVRATADAAGFDTNPGDGATLPPDDSWRPTADEPAWLGASRAARAVRQRHAIGAGPLNDKRLADLLAVDPKVLETPGTMPFSYEFDGSGGAGRVVLRRTGWKVNRRFDLARLLADRLVKEPGDHLLPATRSGTYRQKWQRAFAAELLCPFDALMEHLAGDFSDEAKTGAAEHFDVSSLAVGAILVNHRVVSRGELLSLESV